MNESIKARWLKKFGDTFDGPETIVCGKCRATVHGYKGKDVYILCLKCFTNDIHARLKSIRKAIIAERVSTGEIMELQFLAECIEPGDVLLLEWAGVPEN